MKFTKKESGINHYKNQKSLRNPYPKKEGVYENLSGNGKFIIRIKKQFSTNNGYYYTTVSQHNSKEEAEKRLKEIIDK